MGNFDCLEAGSDEAKLMEEMRKACQQMENLIKSILKDGREKSLVLTKLDELSMWANRSICK